MELGTNFAVKIHVGGLGQRNVRCLSAGSRHNKDACRNPVDAALLSFRFRRTPGGKFNPSYWFVVVGGRCMSAPLELPLVLIVDAEAVNCRLFEAKLTRTQEFRVVSATNGSTATRLAAQDQFHVLLWDLRLGETLTLLPRLRAFSPQSVLLLTTTDDRWLLPSAFHRLDVTDVLVKPLNLDILLQKVRKAAASAVQQPTAVTLELLVVGQQIVLRRDVGTCLTRVVTVGLDAFTVAAPPRVEAPADFTPGAFVEIVLQGDDAVYHFETHIQKRIEQPIPQWQLVMPQTIHREQRRKSPRKSVQAEVLLSPNDPELPLPIQAVARDVSMDGLAVVSEQQMPVGAEVTFDLRQHGQESLIGFGRIVRSVERPTTLSTQPAQYEVAVEFTSLPMMAKRRLRSLVEKGDEKTLSG
jgi:CheY-like chemotaxis protein/c-di-GMP-binding flagellar brake protein YcgR